MLVGFFVCRMIRIFVLTMFDKLKVKELFMRKTSLIILMSTVLFGNDIKKIKETIHSNWDKVAQKNVTGLVHPDGNWMANSEGGFWIFLTVEDNKALIEESPNTLNLKAHHINVNLYGPKKDLAYVVYYLSGSIERDGKVLISNYRTRASNLLKKEKGKWLTVGAHYSPMHSGSGVKFD